MIFHNAAILHLMSFICKKMRLNYCSQPHLDFVSFNVRVAHFVPVLGNCIIWAKYNGVRRNANIDRKIPWQKKQKGVL
jgi:hypothetical protein